MSARSDPLVLPVWAVVSPRRRAHIIRVTKLLMTWADALELDTRERAAWRDAGAWHDALRDASYKEQGRPEIDPTLPKYAWHGPAAAARLRAGGERRRDVLDAITWHTLGNPEWKRTGRALFCADFLEPGRKYARKARAELAERFPTHPDTVLREVVRMRLDIALAQRESIHPRTVALWEVVR